MSKFYLFRPQIAMLEMPGKITNELARSYVASHSNL